METLGGGKRVFHPARTESLNGEREAYQKNPVKADDKPVFSTVGKKLRPAAPFLFKKDYEFPKFIIFANKRPRAA